MSLVNDEVEKLFDTLETLQRRIEITLNELNLLYVTAENNKDYLTMARIKYLQELLK